MNSQPKFIFITGGVVSSLGKGLASASLASLLQSRGFKVRLRKLDPYLNVDPGTMSPYQHGEVFVTDDGTEADLDLGHYERFSGVPAKKTDSITTGKIYQRVIDKERHGDYLGATIQVIPHVTNEIKDFILSDVTDEDFVLCEIGGTVGDIEGQPYLETIRQVAYDLGRDRAMFIHVTLLPFIPTAGELKTKPTQHSVKNFRNTAFSLICCSAAPRWISLRTKNAKSPCSAISVKKTLLRPKMSPISIRFRLPIPKRAWILRSANISALIVTNRQI